MTSNPRSSNVQAQSDEALVAAARDGDQVAFRELVRRYEPVVAATVTGMLGPGAEADDVGQETMIRLYDSLDRFQGRAQIKTYVTRIAINRSIDALRRRKRRAGRFFSRDDEAHAPSEPCAPGDAPLDARERTALVQQAIRQLKPDHRAVVVLRLLDGYSTQETADLLGLPLGTVLSRLARAKAHLETLLHPYLDADDR